MKIPTEALVATTANAKTRAATLVVASARAINRLIHSALTPSTEAIANTKSTATMIVVSSPPNRLAATANSAARDTVSNETANNAPTPGNGQRASGGDEAAKHAEPETADWRAASIGRTDDAAQVDDGEHE